MRCSSRASGASSEPTPSRRAAAMATTPASWTRSSNELARRRPLAQYMLGVSAALAVAACSLSRLALMFTGASSRNSMIICSRLGRPHQIDQAGAITLKHDLFDTAFHAPLSGLYWQVADAGRVVLRSRSLSDSPLTLGAASAKPGELQEGEMPEARQAAPDCCRASRAPSSNDERPLQLAVAGDCHVIDEARGDFAKVVALSLAIPQHFSPRRPGCRSTPALLRSRPCASTCTRLRREGPPGLKEPTRTSFRAWLATSTVCLRRRHARSNGRAPMRPSWAMGYEPWPSSRPRAGPCMTKEIMERPRPSSMKSRQ